MDRYASTESSGSNGLIQINIENPDQPQVRALLDAGDAYMSSLYPPESNHTLDLKSLQKPGVTFLVARDDGQAVACIALVDSGDDWMEIKRMFVSPAARGRKVGRLLLNKLESMAADKGAPLLRLEAGPKQPEALALYRSAGYVERGPFGNYRPDPLSVFMEKQLARV